MRGVQIEFCRGIADGFKGGRIGNCSRELVDLVEGLRVNLCYYYEEGE